MGFLTSIQDSSSLQKALCLGLPAGGVPMGTDKSRKLIVWTGFKLWPPLEHTYERFLCVCVHIRLAWAMLMSFICKCKVSGHFRLSARGTYFPCDGDFIIPYAPPASKLEPSPSYHMVWVSISNLSVKFVKYPRLSDHFALDNFSKISLNISSFFGHSSICLFPILLVCLWEIDPVSFQTSL